MSASRLPPFQRFLDGQREVVWRYLVSTVGAAEADDCFQETFIAALRAYPRLRADSDLRAWVLTIAHRKAIDAHRARARAPIALADPTTAVDGGASTSFAPAGSSDQEPGRDEQAELWAAVGALPPRQRSAVVLRFVADLAHRDIASAIGCSEQAARRSLHEGLTTLRKAVEA